MLGKRFIQKGRRALRKAVILLFAAAYICSYPVPREVYQLGLASEAEVKFYAANLPQQLPCGSVVYNGINYEVTSSLKEAGKLRERLEVTYQTVVFEGGADYVIRFLRPVIVEKQQVTGGTLYTGYCGMIAGRQITYKGRPVNVQIFEKGGKVHIGSPTIFGSF
jgi:hypothetical protein